MVADGPRCYMCGGPWACAVVYTPRGQEEEDSKLAARGTRCRCLALLPPRRRPEIENPQLRRSETNASNRSRSHRRPAVSSSIRSADLLLRTPAAAVR